MVFDWTMLIRLIAAVVFGGAIGYERGIKHDAGLRTHMIVCLGAASVMILSECVVKQYGVPNEIMRLGAQVISGIGFLGAGSIIVDGNRVRGITTAAGLWTTACVGLVVGAGYYIIAAVIVALMLFAMLGLKSLTKSIKTKAFAHTMRVCTVNREVFGEVLKTLTDRQIEIRSIKSENLPQEGKFSARLEMLLPRSDMFESILCDLGSTDGVLEISE